MVKKTVKATSEEPKYPKVVISISPARKAVITLSEYKGKKQLMVREQFLNDEEEFQFGKNGLNIPLAKITKEKCQAISTFFSKLADKLEDSGDED